MRVAMYASKSTIAKFIPVYEFTAHIALLDLILMVFFTVVSYSFFFFKVETLVFWVLLLILTKLLSECSDYIEFWLNQEKSFIVKLFLLNITIYFFLLHAYYSVKLIMVRNYIIIYYMLKSFVKKIFLWVNCINNFSFFLNNLFILSFYSELELEQFCFTQPSQYVWALHETSATIEMFEWVGEELSFLSATDGLLCSNILNCQE